MLTNVNGNITIDDVGPALDRCRKDIADFKRLRLVTEAAMNGIIPCKVPPEQLAAIVQRSRDPLREREAARQHREFLKLLYKREPTAEELRQGPPSFDELGRKLAEEGVIAPAEDGMGNPLLAAMGTSWILPAAAVVGGAWGLSMLFAAMAGAEASSHREAGIISAIGREGRQWVNTVKTWALPTALAAGVAGLAYWWFVKAKPKRAVKAKAAVAEAEEEEEEEALELPPPRSEMRANVEEPEEDEDEGEEEIDAEAEAPAEE